MLNKYALLLVSFASMSTFSMDVIDLRPAVAPWNETYARKYPLHCAVKESDIARVQELLDEGYQVDVRDSLKETPLMQVAEIGATNMVKFLLNNGADLEKLSGHYPQTALHRAASGGHKDIVHLLIDKGALLDKRDFLNRNAAMLAIYMGSYEIAELLLKHGVSVPEHYLKALDEGQKLRSKGE